jgi:hypothetical protein
MVNLIYKLSQPKCSRMKICTYKVCPSKIIWYANEIIFDYGYFTTYKVYVIMCKEKSAEHTTELGLAYLHSPEPTFFCSNTTYHYRFWSNLSKMLTSACLIDRNLVYGTSTSDNKLTLFFVQPTTNQLRVIYFSIVDNTSFISYLNCTVYQLVPIPMNTDFFCEVKQC